MTALPASVHFEQHELRIIDREGKAWLTGTDLARALGYQRADKVTRLYTRNSDEFSEDMTAMITLKAAESVDTPISGVSKNLQSKTRIFSPRGCHLIAMLARTDQAKSFRRWVLDVLENIDGKQPVPAQAGGKRAPRGTEVPYPNKEQLLAARNAGVVGNPRSINPADISRVVRALEASPGLSSSDLAGALLFDRTYMARIISQASLDKRIVKMGYRWESRAENLVTAVWRAAGPDGTGEPLDCERIEALTLQALPSGQRQIRKLARGSRGKNGGRS